MTRILTLIALSTIAFSVTACGGDECEKAADKMVHAYEKCDLEVFHVIHEEGAECSESTASELECELKCHKEAGCEGLDGSDVEASEDHLFCLIDC